MSAAKQMLSYVAEANLRQATIESPLAVGVSKLHTIDTEACIGPEASCVACVGVLLPYDRQ